MNIAILSFGFGGGHVAMAYAIYEAFKRNNPGNLSFTILTDSHLENRTLFPEVEVCHIQLDPQKIFRDDKNTALFTVLQHLDPDVIIVDVMWLIFKPISRYFRAKQVIMFHYVQDKVLHFPLRDGSICSFDAEEYDLAVSMEPHFNIPGCRPIPPVVNTHPSVLHPPHIIRERLNVPSGKKMALLAHSGLEGEIEKLKDDINIDPEEYCLRSISTFDRDEERLFPLAPYLTGVDFAIGGCGWFFYETKALGIPSLYIPQPRLGNEQHWRLEMNRDYAGPYDGADNLAEMILALN